MPVHQNETEAEVYCASEKAIEVAALAYFAGSRRQADKRGLSDALIAAHHPDLGMDRSVCLQDVYDVLEATYHPQNPSDAHPADVIYDRFGRGGDTPS